jgi:Tfp pilus assembly protein PilW
MTLIELLISLAISTSLLVALAAVFHASSSAIELNDSYFRCTQTTRVALDQIVTELRRADAVKVAPGCDSIQVIRPADQLERDEVYRQFSYDPAGKRITLQIFYAGNRSSPVYELAANITACTFGPADTGTDSNNAPVALRIPISITCSTAGNSVTLTGAATPRRSLRY